jgi:hypothetical protein
VAVPGEAEEELRELTSPDSLRLLVMINKSSALSEVASLVTAVERRNRGAVLGEAEVVTKPPELSEAARLIAAFKRRGCEAILGEAGDVCVCLVARMVRTAPPQQQVHQSDRGRGHRR